MLIVVFFSDKLVFPRSAKEAALRYAQVKTSPVNFTSTNPLWAKKRKRTGKMSRKLCTEKGCNICAVEYRFQTSRRAISTKQRIFVELSVDSFTHSPFYSTLGYHFLHFTSNNVHKFHKLVVFLLLLKNSFQIRC